MLLCGGNGTLVGCNEWPAAVLEDVEGLRQALCGQLLRRVAHQDGVGVAAVNVTKVLGCLWGKHQVWPAKRTVQCSWLVRGEGGETLKGVTQRWGEAIAHRRPRFTMSALAAVSAVNIWLDNNHDDDYQSETSLL